MSFRTALSGINAATTNLGVISNNIANVNSVGFKGSRAEFVDLVGTLQTRNATSTTGRGTQLSTINQSFTQGNITSTGNSLDLAVSGNGFFTVEDNGTRLYTRNGVFHTDKDGFVVNSSGHRLQAFQIDPAGNVTATVDDLVISQADNPPRASGKLDVGVNLDASDAVPGVPFNLTDPLSFNSSTSATIFDSLGSEHIATLFFAKTAANQWDMHFALDGATVGGANALQFDTTGALISPAGGQVALSFTPPGAALQNLTVDLNASTQFGSAFSVNSLAQDGFATGRLTGVDVSREGIVQARYSNGQTTGIGQVVMAAFADTQALEQAGQSEWVETAASGPALIGAPSTATLGEVLAGSLEEANVDITEMLVELITAQRNFQANAKTIETTDAMTQSILGIR